ncbi:hypothetical protein Esti_005867 [Eimeria stiedai]
MAGREEAVAGEGPEGSPVGVSLGVQDDEARLGDAGEAAGLLEIEARLQVDPEIAKAKELEPSLLRSPVGRLEAWASLLPQATTELLDELGGGYLFLLSGDGLLLHLLQKHHLDADLKRGFQPLRIIYQAERLLKQMEAAGGHFTIVFFKVFAAAEAVHPLFALLQQLLQLHLTKQGVRFLCLDHWFSASFSAAVSSLHPLFLLLNDVHMVNVEEEMFRGSSDEETESETTEGDSTTDTEGGGQWADPREVLKTRGGDHWSLPDQLSLDVHQLQADALRCIKKRGFRCVSLLLQSLCLCCCKEGLDVAFMQGLVVKPTKLFARSASCYAGANLWRAMEACLPHISSSISSSGNGSGSDAAEGAAPEEQQQQQQQQQCSLRAALELHAKMLEEIGVLLSAEEEAAQQQQRQEEAALLHQQLQQLSQQLQQPTVPVSYAVLQKYCEFLRATAEEDEKLDEEEQQQLERFLAVGKLLLLAAGVQQQLELEERSHCYPVASRQSPFVRRFLYAPLRLYCSQLHELLAKANLLLQQQQQEQQKSRLLRLLDGRDVADLFDGKLLVSLIGLAAAAARSSGNWSVPAAAVGLPADRINHLEQVWRACAGGSGAGSSSASSIDSPLFPISLESLRPLLNSASSLPPPRSGRAAAAGEQQQQQESDCGAHLLRLPSSFLYRLRAGPPPSGALPFVRMEQDKEELSLLKEDCRMQLKIETQLQELEEGSSEEEEGEEIGGTRSPEDSEGEASPLEKERSNSFQRLIAVRAGINEARCAELQPTTVEDAPSLILKETLSLDDSRTPSRYELQKMENMNGEEKRKFWEARLRRRMQQNLRNVTRMAKSICPYPLHFNIVVNRANHPWRVIEQQQEEAAAAAATAGAAGTAGAAPARGKGKGSKQQQQQQKKEKPAVTKKADLIRAKNSEMKQQKVKGVDAERADNLENLLESLCQEKSAVSKARGGLMASFLFKGKSYVMSPTCLRELLLEALIGAGRRMDLLLGLPAVTRVLKTKAAQKQFALSVHALVNSAYRDFAREKCSNKECFLEMRRLLCLLFRLNVEIARLFLPCLTGAEMQQLQQSLLGLGFRTTGHLLFESWKAQQLKLHAQAAAEALADKPATHKKASKEAEVQLRFMGGDFERSTRHPSLPTDNRVLFEPDFWQSRLFDAVDSYASAFVSAPTASGKTYVCFYAMELVLRDSNEGCVVYVCPNKALAQQVYAEIYGRFSSKSYPINCKKILSAQLLQGVCTPKALDAQASSPLLLLLLVFVTVPYFLELLLLSGQANHREFCSHIKYVVLDEVHCIAEQEEGAKWERIIQLLPCPFLAMSATVGNADSFLAWLRRSSPKHDIRFVSHMERFSDLHMHVYDEKRIVPLNPIAALHYTKASASLSQIVGEGLARDFYVPPQDGLHFYYCLSRILGPKSYFSQNFNPAFYFQETAAITKKQYRYYWHTMREHFVSLVRETKELTIDRFAQLQQELQESRPTWTDDLNLFSPIPALKRAADAANAQNSRYVGCLRDMQARDVFAKAYLEPEVPNAHNAYIMHCASNCHRLQSCMHARSNSTGAFLFVCCSVASPQKLLALCRMLSSCQLLPGLIFNFSRPQVRRMGCGLSALLERRQWEKYYGTEEAAYRTRAINKQRMEQYEALLQEREVARRMRGMSRQQREAQGLDKQDLATLEEGELPPPPGDIAEEVDEEFSFANPKAMGTNFDEIKAVLKDVHVRASSKQDALLAKLLERGVGLFDDGLSKGYRVAVELLYRWGFLRLIICTHALALGMNLPCKSAVFAGDALVLTPTMFKQASQAGGRAGRRGYDSAGHIIFWEVPFRRINRLLEARLPVFSGDFPVTPMLTLRALRLNAQLEAAHATDLGLEDRLNRLFLNPLYSVSGANHLPSEKELQLLRFYIRYHVRFAADFLHRAGLLNRWGQGDCGVNKFAFVAELLFENKSGALLLHFLIIAAAVLQQQLFEGQKQLQQQLLCSVLLLFHFCVFRANLGTLQNLAREADMSQQQKLRVLLQFLAVCCGSEEGAEVPSNFVLQQLLQHRTDVAKVRAKRFALQSLDAAAAANIPAASQQLHSDFKPFTKTFRGDMHTAIEAFNQMALSSTAGCLQAAAFIVDQREGKVFRDYELPFTGLPFSKEQQQQQQKHEQQQQQQEGEDSHDTLFRAFKKTVSFRTADEFFLTKEHFALCISKEFAANHSDSETSEAPLTSWEYMLWKSSCVEKKSVFFSVVEHMTSPSSLQSPFAALSCLDDKEVACSMERLSDSLRMSLPFQAEVMCALASLKRQRFPALDGAANRSVLVEMLQRNSYLEDLFVHGSLMRVVQENGIAPEHLWSLLQRFVVSLKRLEEGLRSLFLMKELDAGNASRGELEVIELVALAHKRLKEVLEEQAA